MIFLKAVGYGLVVGLALAILVAIVPIGDVVNLPKHVAQGGFIGTVLWGLKWAVPSCVVFALLVAVYVKYQGPIHHWLEECPVPNFLCIVLEFSGIGLVLGAMLAVIAGLAAGGYSPDVQERYGFVAPEHVIDLKCAGETILYLIRWTAPIGLIAGFVTGLLTPTNRFYKTRW